MLAFSRHVRPYINVARLPFFASTQAATRAEIIALRHQVLVLQRTQETKRLLLRPPDRWLWIGLSRMWSGWRSALIIVKPETVLSWHRKAFRWYWTWKIRHGQTGRPRISKETRDLIRTMSRMNVLWGAPRVHSELLKLGIKVSEATVAKYMVRHRKPPSQTCRKIHCGTPCVNSWSIIISNAIIKVLENALMVPIKTTHEITGPVQCRQRLGGLLNYYYRKAA